MSERDVYDGEMLKKRLSDQDIERILSGRDPEDANLARLGPALAALHHQDIAAPSNDTVARFAAEAAAIARESKPEHRDDPAVPEPARARRFAFALRDKLAVVAVAIFVMAGMTGVAAASDDAAPGDFLYGLDRALEAVGVNDGGASERITEAQSLASDGRVTEAISHVAEAVETPEDGESVDDFSPESTNAAIALRDAAESVRDDNDDPESQEVRDAVSAMLTEMADMLGDPDFDGAEFGRRVSEMARSIANPVDGPQEGDQDETEQPADNRPDDAGPPEGEGNGPPDDTPGGPPDDIPGGPPEGTPGGPGGGGPPGGGPPGP